MLSVSSSSLASSHDNHPSANRSICAAVSVNQKPLLSSLSHFKRMAKQTIKTDNRFKHSIVRVSLVCLFVLCVLVDLQAFGWGCEKGRHAEICDMLHKKHENPHTDTHLNRKYTFFNIEFLQQQRKTSENLSKKKQTEIPSGSDGEKKAT